MEKISIIGLDLAKQVFWPEPEKPAAVIGRNVRRDDREPVRIASGQRP